MKAKVLLMTVALPISLLGYSQSTFLEKNREIFDQMHSEIRKATNDFQITIRQMASGEFSISEDENEGDLIHGTFLNETLTLDASNESEAFPDIYPVSSEARLTSGYGYRTDPFIGKRAFHGGIDLAVPQNTSVVSCASGRVEKAGYTRINGNFIIIDHGNKYKSYYGHLSKILVKKDDAVTKGQAIGLSGNTGRSTGPHIHFQISLEGKTIDPLTLIN